jgi:DNA-directed RNA polymerase specialized sigma24 family protein
MDCSIDEISAYIGAPAGTIKSYLSRARERMRFELKKLGIEDI